MWVSASGAAAAIGLPLRLRSALGLDQARRHADDRQRQEQQERHQLAAPAVADHQLQDRADAERDAGQQHEQQHAAQRRGGGGTGRPAGGQPRRDRQERGRYQQHPRPGQDRPGLADVEHRARDRQQEQADRVRQSCGGRDQRADDRERTSRQQGEPQHLDHRPVRCARGQQRAGIRAGAGKGQRRRNQDEAEDDRRQPLDRQGEPRHHVAAAAAVDRVDQGPPLQPGERPENPQHRSDPVEHRPRPRVALRQAEEQLLEGPRFAPRVAQLRQGSLRHQPAPDDDADV